MTYLFNIFASDSSSKIYESTAINSVQRVQGFRRGRDCQSVERPSGSFVALPAFARQDGITGRHPEQTFIHIKVVPQIERQPDEGMGCSRRKDERHLDFR